MRVPVGVEIVHDDTLIGGAAANLAALVGEAGNGRAAGEEDVWQRARQAGLRGVRDDPERALS